MDPKAEILLFHTIWCKSEEGKKSFSLCGKGWYLVLGSHVVTIVCLKSLDWGLGHKDSGQRAEEGRGGQRRAEKGRGGQGLSGCALP